MVRRFLVITLILGTVLVGTVGFTLVRTYMSPASRTGIVVSNESATEALFVIDSDFRDGSMTVSPGSVDDFDVYQGFYVPPSFSVTIFDVNGKALFEGRLGPGLGCWSFFVWDGLQLEFQHQSICV